MPSGPLRQVGAGGAQWGILSLNKRWVYLLVGLGGAGEAGGAGGAGCPLLRYQKGDTFHVGSLGKEVGGLYPGEVVAPLGHQDF